MQSVGIQKLFCQDSYGHLEYAVERVEHCLNQLSDEQIWWRPTENQNSIGNLVLHICGNVSQWILSGVGGLPNTRDRPSEFSERGPLEHSLLALKLQESLTAVQQVLETVDEARLLESWVVQGFQTTGLGAITHSVTHFTGHMQEIICLTRMQLGADYQFKWQPETESQST